eukprot:gene8591-10178_t
MNNTHNDYINNGHNGVEDDRDDDRDINSDSVDGVNGHPSFEMDITSQHVEELIGEAIEEGQRIASELPQTHLPQACSTWFLGANMSYKVESTLRVATLNVGATASQGAWCNFLPEGIARLMDDQGIDILCLQELHICKPLADQPDPIAAAFARVSLHFVYNAPPPGLRQNSYSGVGIILPASWPCPTIFCPMADQQGRCIAAIVSCAHNTHNLGDGQIGIMSVYGHTGATMAGAPAAVRTSVRQLKDRVRECEAWLASQHCQSVVICTDANQILDTDTDCTPPNSPQYARCAEGFLAACVEEMSYVDALRCCVPAGTPIITFSTAWRQALLDNTAVPDHGSYLDRILARNVSVLRSGGLAPGFCAPYLARPPDHAVIVADLHISPIASTACESSFDPRRQRSPLVRIFLREAVAAKREGGNNPEEFLRRLDTFLAEDEKLQRTVADIEAAVTRMSNDRPLSSQATAEHETDLQELTSKFISDLYFPLIQCVAGPPSRPPALNQGLDNAGVLKGVNEILLASSLWPGAPVDFTCKPSQFFSGAPSSAVDVAKLIQQTWTSLCNSLPPDLHPSGLRDLFQQCSRFNDESPGEALISIKQNSLRVAGRLQFSLRAAAAIKRTEDATALYQHDISGFFRRTMLSASHPPTMPSYAFHFDPSQCSEQPSSHVAALSEATKQHWQKLYGFDPWNPPSIFIQRRDPGTGHMTVQMGQWPAAGDETKKEVLLYDAMQKCRSNVVNWEAVMAPISDDDFTRMFDARWGRAPGITGMKMCAMQFMPAPVQSCLRSLLQCMWCLQIIPVSLKTTLLALLEKPNGGQRGISLMEEMLMALDSLLAERIKSCLLPGYSIDHLLSPLNKAYKPGKSISDIIHAHALTLEDAVIRRLPLVCAMTDLSKFYDTIQMAVIEVVLRLKGCTQRVISIIRAMYTGSLMRVLTHFCLTETFARARGLHQGSPLSCVLCLLFLEPYLRALENLPAETAYNFENSLTAQDEMYSDDATKLSNSIAGMQARLDATDPILALCGMGQDKEKAMVISANIDLSMDAPASVSVLSYNRNTGSLETFSVPVLDIADPRAKYRLLGAFFWKGVVDEKKSKHALRSVQLRLARVKWLHLPHQPTITLINACVLSKVADATVLMSPLSISDLSKVDSQLARCLQQSFGLPLNTPRGWAFAATSTGGGGAWSATAWLLHATLRETLILLNSPTHSGKLARRSFRLLSASDHPQRTQCILYRAITLLGTFGLHVHSSEELLHCRALSFLRYHTDDVCANMIARSEVTRITRSVALKWTTLSESAAIVRSAVALLQRAAPHCKSHHSVPSLAEVEAIVAASSEFSYNDRETLFEFLPALTAARKAAKHDWETYCRAVVAHSQDQSCPSEEKSFQNDRTGDNRTVFLTSPLRLPQRFAALDRAETETFVTATDGGTTGCALVVLQPPRVQGSHLLDPYNCPTAPRNADIIMQLSSSLPPSVGNDLSNSYPCESVANHLDLRLRRSTPLGAAFIDNQSVLDKICAPPLTDTRRLIKQGRPHIHHVLFALQQALQLSVLYRDRERTDRHVCMTDAWKTAARIFHSSPSVGPFVKVKSHQVLPCGIPCFTATFANDLADRLVTEAEKHASQHDQVHIPPARGRFFTVDNLGRMITTALRVPVVQRMRSDAIAHWADRAARPVRGLAASLLQHIHPAAPHFAKYPVQEIAQRVSGVIVTRPLLTRHFLRVGGSWSSFLYVAPDRIHGVESAYAELFPDLAHRDNAIDWNLCPFCLHHGIAAVGDGHHYRSGTCADPEIAAEVLKVLRAVEECLTTMAPVQCWLSQFPPAIAEAAIPVLSASTWMVQAEAEAPARSASELWTEEVQKRKVMSLGWRCGTTPYCLRYSPEPLSAAEVHLLEVTKAVLLEQFAVFLMAKFQEAHFYLVGLTEDGAQLTPPPPTLTASLSASTPATSITCLEPGCLAAAQQHRALLCAKHAQLHRQSLILRELQRHILAKDVLTPVVSEMTFLRPPRLQNYIAGLLNVCQHSLRVNRHLERVRQLSSELAEELLQKAMLPYLDPATNTATWNRSQAPGTLCACQGVINPTARNNLSLCLHCNQMTNEQDDILCNGCGLRVHSQQENCRPCFSTATGPAGSSLWFCPKCQLCITSQRYHRTNALFGKGSVDENEQSKPPRRLQTSKQSVGGRARNSAISLPRTWISTKATRPAEKSLSQNMSGTQTRAQTGAQTEAQTRAQTGAKTRAMDEDRTQTGAQPGAQMLQVELVRGEGGPWNIARKSSSTGRWVLGAGDVTRRSDGPADGRASHDEVTTTEEWTGQMQPCGVTCLELYLESSSGNTSNGHSVTSSNNRMQRLHHT